METTKEAIIEALKTSIVKWRDEMCLTGNVTDDTFSLKLDRTSCDLCKLRRALLGCGDCPLSCKMSGASKTNAHNCLIYYILSVVSYEGLRAVWMYGLAGEFDLEIPYGNLHVTFSTENYQDGLHEREWLLKEDVLAFYDLYRGLLVEQLEYELNKLILGG